MNDDLVVQKILKLLENNTSFIGYALNGGIGTKINIRNTETGKTIQALSVNVDSSGEVLIVKDSEDGEYKAVSFKSAEQAKERIIQLRNTKPVDDKKVIDYTDADIEVFYLFVKLVDTGSPIPTSLESTWIRKGSSCTQFVGAYERCNYASKATIGGVSYTGLPYITYSNLNDCLNDDLGRDATTPHGSGDENGLGLGYKIYSTKMTAEAEEELRIALESHDSNYGTTLKNSFGYATILDCGGGMYVQGWEVRINSQTGQSFYSCDFSYLPGFTTDCTPAMQNAGYCDIRGFISSKAPLFGQEEPGQPSVGNVDNTWGHQYGWVDLPYEFMYKRHFPYNYLNGSNAKGSFVVFEINDDQTPTIPDGYFRWIPGCPGNGQAGPFNGTGGNRFPEGPTIPKKRDMKLSTHKAEIWLGSSKKTEAIKLYELGASELFSGMYNSFIIRADETRVDVENRLKRNIDITPDEQSQHEKFYQNWNKNIIDLTIDPRVWVYVSNNYPEAAFQGNFHDFINPQNFSLQGFIDGLYHRTLNLSVIDKKLQVVHLKLNLKPANILSNTDCKGNIYFQGNSNSEKFSSQSWEYQKYITIKIKDWKILSTTNTLDTTDLDSTIVWNKDNIERRFLSSFGTFKSQLERDNYIYLLSRHDNLVDFSEIVNGNHFEQYNYSKRKLFTQSTTFNIYLYASNTLIFKPTTFAENSRYTALSTVSWWEMWDKTLYNKKEKRLSSIVGFDLNQYQILRSSKLSPGLIYSGYNSTSGNGYPPYTNAVARESYYEYLSDRPKEYSPSIIRALRNKIIPNSYYNLADRQSTIDSIGLIFYFSDWGSRWSENNNINLPPISLPNDYYDLSSSNMLKSHRFDLPLTSQYENKRIDTRRWTNMLWTQLIYDGVVKVDIDSYKNVEFNLPTNPSQYIKYTSNYTYNNSEYNFSEIPEEDTLIETVLSPGVLDVAKQVPIKKPTNVDLDPNMSFLLYIFPLVSVTKKKKEI